MNSEAVSLLVLVDRFMEHLQPFEGDPCLRCMDSSTFEEGCPEGQQLWVKYREALASHRSGVEA